MELGRPVGVARLVSRITGERARSTRERGTRTPTGVGTSDITNNAERATPDVRPCCPRDTFRGATRHW